MLLSHFCNSLTASQSAFVSEIVNTGNTNIVSVGLVPEDYMSNAAPGWFDGSVGYHGDDGG